MLPRFARTDVHYFLTLACLFVLTAIAPTDSFAQATWRKVSVPGVWKRSPGEIARDGKGHGWYRCQATVPEKWRGRSLTLYAESADDARQFFVNGKPVGSFGGFPPKFRTGLGSEARLKIAKLAADDPLTIDIAIHTYQKEARSNFNVAAPVLFAGDEAISLRGEWELLAADAKLESLGNVAFALKPFSKVISSKEAERTLKQIDGESGPFDVAGTLQRIETFDDLQVSCPLAEPHIGQPLQIKFDARGRMWVVNYKQYPTPAGLKMVSRDKYLRSVYDRLPDPPPNHFRGADQITIHEDTDGDGAYDKHKVFVDGLSLCTSLAIGRGGVFVLNPPYLLFYPDRNGDDIPDGDPHVLLEGFHLEDSHSVCNSLRWGPDGWLYAAQGSTVSGSVRAYASKDKPVHSMGQLIWRYHPEQRKYEIFAEGGGNAFGVEMDAQGRIYSGHNGGDTRGFHYVQGGYYRKGFGKHGELSNPHAYGYFPHIKHHSVPRFTHNFVIYEETLLPAKYHGKLFGVGPLQGHVVMSDVAALGATFQTKDEGHPFQSKDTWVRPVEIRTGPDGAIYVADFYEQRIDHASHYQGRVTPESGRVYRIGPKNGAANEEKQIDNLAALSSTQLLPHLRSPNKWRRQQVQRLLADRKAANDIDEAFVSALAVQLKEASGQHALELLWALNGVGGLDEPAAIRLLVHEEPQVRLWTVRLMCDDFEVSDEFAQRLQSLAGSEPSDQVRCQLACSARRISLEHALPVLRGLLLHNEDEKDPFIPLLLWWALEHHTGADPSQIVTFFDEQSLWKLPLARNHLATRLARRLAATQRRQDMLACADLLTAAPDEQAVTAVMQGIEEAFAGRAVSGLPESLLNAMAQRGKASLAFRVRQGDDEAAKEAVAQVVSSKTPLPARVELTGVFGQTPQMTFLPVLLRLAEKEPKEELRVAAFNSLQAYDDPQVGSLAVRLHDQLGKDAREVAQSLLTSRPAWTAEYVAAVEDGKLKRENVPLAVVRRMLLHQDEKMNAKIKSIWGDVQGATSAQMLERIKLYKEWIADASGNPYEGKRLFANNCGKCHKLFASGGKIGPDLTSYKRDDLHAMLLNIVNPSLEIREGYESYMILTEDGLRLSGFIEDQDEQVVVLKKADGQTTVIAKDEIQIMKAVPVSIMPQGVLSQMTEQEVRDLFAYIRSTQPLP